MTAADARRRCDAWAANGEHLRAAVAWRVYEGKGAILSVVTGVPRAALHRFVDTGDIEQHYRSRLDLAADAVTGAADDRR